MSGAGWYNDESDPTLARWYDGAGWSHHVVVKADWESIGHPPPPPAEPAPPSSVRRRVLVASAVVVAALAAGGLALAVDGDGDGDERTPTVGRSGSVHELDDGATELPDPPTDTSGSDVGGDPAGDTRLAPSTRSTSRSSATTRTSTQSGTVTRTERRSSSHVNPGPVHSVGSGDETSVGNTTDTSIKSTYTPPPDPPPSSPDEPTTTTSAPSGGEGQDPGP